MLKSNVYMDAAGKKPNFRTAKSEFDRKRMEMAAKQWIKKKQPSFDGDVYVENVKCVLSLTEEEKERIRDIRFSITFGMDEVEIKPQMQDIEAVEPFVVTDMNFEREAAE